MECGLTKASLAEVCILVTDGTHDTPKRVPSGFPLIKAKEIASGQIDFSCCDQISEAEHRKVIARSKPEFGDTLFTHIGASLGAAAFVNTTREFSIKNIALFKPNPAIIDPRYLYYLVVSPSFQSLAIGTKTGSAQPFLGLSQLRGHRIQYHRDLVVQKRIAGILSVYDELIENNQRRIEILESMARALYNEWFIYFRFPGHQDYVRVASPEGEIPDGWETIPFEELLTSMTGGDWGSEQPEDRDTAEVVVVRGTDFDEVAYGGQLRSPVRYIKPSSLVSRGLKVGDVIIENSINAKSRSVGTTLLVDSNVLNRLGRDAIAASFCKVFRLHDPRLAPLVHLHARHLREDARMEYYQNVAANGIANFQAQKFAKEEHLILPTDEPTRAKLIEPLTSIFQRIGVHASQLSNLRRTRDLLLARLLSGKFDLSGAEEDGLAQGVASPAPVQVSPPPNTGSKVEVATLETAQQPRDASRPIGTVERDEVLRTIRKVFGDGAERDRDVALRDIAYALGYQRLGPRIREALSGDLIAALRRGIVVNAGGNYRLGFRSFADCPRDALKDAFESAIGRAWIVREDAIRAFARWAGFGRVGDVIDQTARSLINGLIREGRVETNGPELIRRT